MQHASSASGLTRLAAVVLMLASTSVATAPLPLGRLGLDAQAPLDSDTLAKDTGSEVIIAVIDDGFATDLPALKGMIWHNPAETAYNSIDDDNNGYVDDRTGWDIADMDGNIAPPANRRAEFEHGSYTAALIAEVIRARLGERDDYPIKLMLIKAVPDQSSDLNLRLGYQGIDYAVQNGASIISNAWSGGELQPDDARTLNRALAKGATVINSVGNYPSEQASMPAAHPAVLGVAGVDASGRIIERSNYGSEVDLVSIAQEISSVSLSSESGQRTESGTSVAVPVVAATAALMKWVNPDISRDEIQDCLLNTAEPVDRQNPLIPGKLGAGLIQIDAAIECARAPQNSLLLASYRNAKGSFGIDYTSSDKPLIKKWRIMPLATGNGIRLQNALSGAPSDTLLTIRKLDNSGEILWQGELRALADSLIIPAGGFEFELQIKPNSPTFRLRSRYAVMAIDLEKRYCSGKTTIRDTKRINDGSGTAPYAARSNCQWLIKAKPGKAIRIQFTSLDIDPGTDKIYLFSGDSTAQTNLLVTLSGSKIPPTYQIEGGDALLWFLSDQAAEAQGFSADISWINQP